jgi:hypothetical protein
MLLAVGSLSLLGCDMLQPKIDAKLAEQLVSSLLEKEGLKPDSVSCPSNQLVEKGNKFGCKAKVGDVEVDFQLEVLDDKGNVYAAPTNHTLVVSKIEPEIASDLKERGHSVDKVDCHGDVWVAIKGAKVSCDVTDEAGAAYVWTAEFLDDEGKHSHSIKPK